MEKQLKAFQKHLHVQAASDESSGEIKVWDMKDLGLQLRLNTQPQMFKVLWNLSTKYGLILIWNDLLNQLKKNLEKYLKFTSFKKGRTQDLCQPGF